MNAKRCSPLAIIAHTTVLPQNDTFYCIFKCIMMVMYLKNYQVFQLHISISKQHTQYNLYIIHQSNLPSYQVDNF
jgi:hypothetical protein